MSRTTAAAASAHGGILGKGDACGGGLAGCTRGIDAGGDCATSGSTGSSACGSGVAAGSAYTLSAPVAGRKLLSGFSAQMRASMA